MDIFTRTDGKQYHYIKRYAHEVIEPRAEIDFGVRDQKARRVGASRSIIHVTVVLREQRPELCGLIHHPIGLIYPIGDPLTYFEGRAWTLRDGVPFGGSTIEVKGATREEVAAELDKRIERSRKLAVKKFGA